MAEFVIHRNKTSWGWKWHILTNDGMGHVDAEVENEEVGDPFTFYISALSVFETARNKGLGKALIAKAENVAKLAGARRIRLNVEKPDETGLKAYYEKLGYELWDEDSEVYYMVKYNEDE